MASTRPFRARHRCARSRSRIASSPSTWGALRGRQRRPAAPGARRPARPHPSRHSWRPRGAGAHRRRRAGRALPRLRPQKAGGGPCRAGRAARALDARHQQRLIDLGFMAPSGLTGMVDTQTSTAVLGFEKWANLPRDGVLGASTLDQLERATRPEPRLRMPGRRIEVQLRRQLALLIEDNRVVRAVHISSGSGGRTPTGSFHVYRKERYSWSVPFKVWLPWASYFTGGIAFHEYPVVPTYAASHGCVRVNHYDAADALRLRGAGHPGRRLRRGIPVTSPSAVRALAGGIGLVAGIVVCAIVAAGLLALGMPADSRADDPPPPPPSLPSPVRRSSSWRSGSAIRSCRQASCATARSSSPVASRSTSPAISPSASESLAFASSTSSRPRGCSSPRCVPGT